MPKPAAKTKPKSENQILAEASDRLLRAIKEKILQDEGEIDYHKLEREGYSAAMIERMKAV